MKLNNFSSGVCCIKILAILICLGCTAKGSEDRLFLSFLNNQGHTIAKSTNEVYFIIPLEGCSSCIDASLEFISKTEKPNLKAVLTQSSGKKGMRIRVGEKTFNSERVIKDFENELIMQDVVNMDPLLLFYSDGKLLKITTVNSLNIQQSFDDVLVFLK